MLKISHEGEQKRQRGVKEVNEQSSCEESSINTGAGQAASLMEHRQKKSTKRSAEAVAYVNMADGRVVTGGLEGSIYV
jgi:hypothetical protein